MLKECFHASLPKDEGLKDLGMAFQTFQAQVPHGAAARSPSK